MYQPTLPLTMPGARSAQAEGVQAIEAGAAVIDLQSVPAVDSAAVAILLAWRRTAHRQGRTLDFQNPPPALTSLAQLYGVADLLALPLSRH